MGFFSSLLQVAVGFFTGGVGSFLFNIAASYILGKLTEPDSPDAPRDPGVQSRRQANTANKVPVIYGEAIVSGTEVAKLYEPGDKPKKLAVIYALSEGPVESLDKVTWNGRTMSFGGDINTGLRNVTNAVDSEGNSFDNYNDGRVKMQMFRDGGRCLPMENFSSEWNNSSVENLAYVYIEVTYNRDKRVTDVAYDAKFTVRGRKIRTFDGSGNLSSEKTYSTNPAECFVDLMTSSVYGAGFRDEDLDLESIHNHAQLCNDAKSYVDNESNVASAKRYTCNGVAATENNVQTNAFDIIRGTGFITTTLGKFGIMSEKAKDSIAVIGSDDFLGDVFVSSGTESSNLNKLTTTFPAKNSGGQQEQFVGETPISLLNKNEPPYERTINLPFCDNDIMAKRINYIMLNTARQSITFRTRLPIKYSYLQAGDVIKVNDSRNGFDEKEFIISQVNDYIKAVGETLIIEIQIDAQEYAKEIYDDLTLNETDVAPNTTLANPLSGPTITDLTVSEDTTVADSNLLVTWVDDDPEFTREYLISYFKVGSGLVYRKTVAGGTRYTIGTLEPSTNYNISVTPKSVFGTVGFSQGTLASTGISRAPKGANGEFQVYQWKQQTNKPSHPGNTGSYDTDTLTPSSGWSDTIPAEVSGTSIWEVQATVDPALPPSPSTKQIETITPNGVTGTVTNVAAVSERANGTFNGVTGKQITTSAVSEALASEQVGITSDDPVVVTAVAPITRIDVTGTTAGTLTTGTKEQTDVSFSGISDNNTATFETYTLDFSGTWEANGSSADRVSIQELGGFVGAVPPVATGTYTSTEYAALYAAAWNLATSATELNPYTAVASGDTVTATADSSGNLTDRELDPFGTVTGTNTGDPSSVVFTKVNDGAAASLTNVSIGFPSSLSTNPVAFDLTASSTGTSVDTQVKTALDAAVTAGTLTGVTVSAVAGATRVLNTATGNTTDITVTLTNPATLAYTGTVTDGSDGGGGGTLTGLTATVGSPHTPISHSFTLPSGTLIAAGRPLIRNVFLNDISGFTASAIGSNTFFDITSTTAQAEDDVTLTITEAGTGGDLVVSANTTTTGVNGSTTGILDTWAIVARGETRTGTFTALSTASSQGAQIRTGLTANSIPGVNVTGTGADVVLTSVSSGNETDYTLVITTHGTAGSPTQTKTEGVTGSSTGILTTWTVVANSITSTGTFFTESNAVSQAGQVRSGITTGSGYTVSGTGDEVIITSTSTGVETAYTMVISTTGTNQTAVQPTVVRTIGAAAGTTGTLTTFTIELDDAISVADVTGTFTNGSNVASQIDQMVTALGSSLPLTIVDNTGSMQLTHDAGGARTTTDVVYSTTSNSGQTATDPRVVVTQLGVTAVSQLVFPWSVVIQKTGDSGINGYSVATVSVYQRKPGGAPTDAPTDSGTYTFADAELLFGSATSSNNWHTTVPAGSDQLYVRQASAVGQSTTDTIATSEWSGVVQAGSTGSNGVNGLSNGTAVYYQRTSSATAPTVLPGVTSSFNLGTGALTPATNGNWQTLDTLSSTGDYLWLTSATAASRASTDSILSSEWATAKLLSKDGTDGTDGKSAYQSWLDAGNTGTMQDFLDSLDGVNGLNSPRTATGVVYYAIAQSTAPAVPTASLYNFANGEFFDLTNNWARDAATLAASQTLFYWQRTYFITEATFEGDQTIVFGTATKVASFENIVVTGGSAADINNGTTRISGGRVDAQTLVLSSATSGERVEIAVNSANAFKGIRVYNADGTIAVQIGVTS